MKYPAEFRPDAQSGFEYHLCMRLSDQDRNTAEARDRKIIHIYASVVQRDNPDFRGKPVAVGRSRPKFALLIG